MTKRKFKPSPKIWTNCWKCERRVIDIFCPDGNDWVTQECNKARESLGIQLQVKPFCLLCNCDLNRMKMSLNIQNYFSDQTRDACR